MTKYGKVTFSEVKEPSSPNPEALEFDIFIERPAVHVIVTREALDDHASKMGVEIRRLAKGYIEFLQMYHAAFAEAAHRKLAMQETVVVRSGDIILD
ncbi:MAG: hypothetical protein QOI38_1710 [Sphingomonadales bacterium]|jgi:hypothetical protein|nr:hypothetical protein [Sphingomonadales bacterium]